MIPQLPKLVYAGQVTFHSDDLTLVKGDSDTLAQIVAGDEFIINYDPPLIFQADTDVENLVAGSVVSSFTLDVGWTGASGSDSGYVILTADLTTEQRLALSAVDVISTFDYLPLFEGQDIGYQVLSIDGDAGSPTTAIIYRLAYELVEGPSTTGETEFIGYNAGDEFGDMTNADEAFSGTSAKVGADCATAEGESAFIGQVISSNISRAFISGSTDFGFVGELGSPSTEIAASVTIELWAAPAGSPTPGEQDGTLLGSITFTNQADERAPREITSNDSTTVFGHVWFRITSDASPPDPQKYYVSRVEFHKPTTVPDVVQQLTWIAATELPLIQYAGEVTVDQGSTRVVGDATTLATVLESHTLIVNRNGTTTLADVATTAVEEAPQPLTGIYFRIENGWPVDDENDESPLDVAPAIPSGPVSAYRIDTTNGAPDGPIQNVSRIGDFNDRATFDSQAEGFSFVSVEGVGGEEESKRWDRVGSTTGVWKAIELPRLPADDRFENPIRNPQGYVVDPYIEEGAKGDTDLLHQAGWYLLTETFGAEGSEADSDLTFARGLKLTKTSSTGRLGAAQVILQSKMPHLFGQSLIAIGKVRVRTNEGSPVGSPTFNPVVGVAVCSDPYTDDTPIDLVGVWDSDSLTIGGFFRTESPDDLVVNAASTMKVIEGEMMPFALAIDAIDLAQGRLMLFYWSDEALDPGDTLEITELDLRVVDYKPFKPQQEEIEKVPVGQHMPETATFAIAQGYTTSHSNTLLDPFPGVGAEVTLTVETQQWFQRNATVYVTNKKDAGQAFRMRVTEYDGATLTGIVNKSNGDLANNDWVVAVAPGVPSGGGSTPTSITYVGKATSSGGDTLTATLDSGTIQVGDILVWGDLTSNNISLPLVIPSGFSLISSLNPTNFRQVFAVKLADENDDGATITGLAPGGSFPMSCKTLLCFRPDKPADSYIVGDPAGEFSLSAPSNQTISASAGAAPLIKVALYGAYKTTSVEIDPRGWDTGKDGESEVTDSDGTEFIETWLAYEINNSAPADTVVSMQDEGNNFLQSCYIAVSGFSSEPGDTVIFEDDGSGDPVYPDADWRNLIKLFVGCVIPWPFTVEPTWGQFPDGATLNRADYPSLWARVETGGNIAASEGAKTIAQFGPGDGSSTFTLPNLFSGDRYLRFGSTIAVQAGGVPNITGSLNQGAGQRYTSASGAHAISNSTTQGAATGGNSGSLSSNFDASNSNALYGAATEVRPVTIKWPAILVTGEVGT